MTLVNVTLLLILPEAIACEHLDLERAIACHCMPLLSLIKALEITFCYNLQVSTRDKTFPQLKMKNPRRP
ncbi:MULTISPECIES: hypothetical protein [unclassified Coleofasciculus]|uniref:hypothetical protein n=1 Tax=Cyanophyceae TaxID=3028117 RepID=UPI0016828D63|nr:MULTISPECIES: hypothetical protein [unclassified Coleofasciculus]MBD1836820.1 hypothetical protein [Coleofasciculus sp. FACHB-501]MBD2540528.1 hypothetical protein [Coleofasciculus sp. FACHB-SPT36]